VPLTFSAAADSSEHEAERGSSTARVTFVLIAVALLPIMVFASFDFGATWDERDRHHYGELVLEFFKGLRRRSDFTEEVGGLYGGLFDTLCAALEQWVPMNRYVLRHVVTAAFGWAGVVYCGRLAARLFGTWSGVLAMVLLAASPRYFADAMNNPKDLPFAAATVAALYYIATISTKWPYVSRATAVKIVLALAVALNIRAGALIYLGYFGLLVLAYTLTDRTTDWRRLAGSAGRLVTVTLATLVLGTVVWPWAQAAPLTRPIEALLFFSNFPWTGTHVLFDGRDYNPAELPWQYVPWWFLISTPPVVLVGALLACASRDRSITLRRCALWIVALLPIVLVVVRHSTLYNGVRQLLFIYPVLVVLAASGWTAWLSAPTPPRTPWIVAALLAAGLLDIGAFDVRNHPNETVYFNQLAGGPRGAFTKYEMDYWGNCMLEAVTWSADAARRAGVPVAVSGDFSLLSELVQTNAERFHNLYVTVPGAGRHALHIQLVRGTPDDFRAIATRADALHRVQTADGTVLCVVLPGPRFAELEPYLARSQVHPRNTQ
jgi:hypothetical protein